jgi:formylmethanofuran dehydrogenase subunit D
VKEIKVILISGRTSQQGVGLEEGKTSETYRKSVGYIEISSSDADFLNLKNENPVRVSNEQGSIVVEWKKTDQLEQGIAFIPYGPWANHVFSYETEGTGMPLFKGIDVTIEEAPDQGVPTLMELVENFRREKDDGIN